jgi:hypothetical protein
MFRCLPSGNEANARSAFDVKDGQHAGEGRDANDGKALGVGFVGLQHVIGVSENRGRLLEGYAVARLPVR